jgi:transposase InsO family protein
MPWEKVEEMKLRNRFVILAREKHANISKLCRDFGISRSVGYKLLKRYENEGLKGIVPRSKSPKTRPLAVSAEFVCEVVSLRREHPTWGARLLRELLCDIHENSKVPSARTIDRIIDRAGLVVKRRRSKGEWLDKHPIEPPTKPNALWSVDFKGWWWTKNRIPCFPLTIRDGYSRYVLDIRALRGTGYEGTKAAFEEAFERYGLPDEILSDNGCPFGTVLAVQGLTRLSAWWVKLGIRPRRILPGCPFMNGSHERMHRDMKAELQQSPCWNLKDEQKRFDHWREEYNTLRPNQAIGMKRPTALYHTSTRTLLQAQREFEYPKDMEVRRASSRGFISWHQKLRFIAGALSNETVGLREERNNTLSIWFCELKLGSSSRNFDYPLGGNQAWGGSPYSFRHARNRKV